MKYLIILLLFTSCHKTGVYLVKNEKDERYLCSQSLHNVEIGDFVLIDVVYKVESFTEGDWFNYQLKGGYKERALPEKVDSFSIKEWSYLKKDSIQVTYEYVGTCK